MNFSHGEPVAKFTTKMPTLLEEAAAIVERGDVSALKLLSLRSVINNHTESERTLLYIACARGHLEIVKELLKYDGIDPHIGVSREL